VLLLAVVSTVLYLMNRTELVAREITLLLNRTLKDHSDLVLDLRDIRGNPFTGFRRSSPASISAMVRRCSPRARCG
jgi:hypothetical protein